MATEAEIAKSMGEYLRANGYTCGRKYSNIGDLARTLASGAMPGESETTLAPKIRAIVATPSYRFKTSGHDDVSASDAADPKCGN